MLVVKGMVCSAPTALEVRSRDLEAEEAAEEAGASSGAKCKGGAVDGGSQNERGRGHAASTECPLSTLSSRSRCHHQAWTDGASSSDAVGLCSGERWARHAFCNSR